MISFRRDYCVGTRHAVARKRPIRGFFGASFVSALIATAIASGGFPASAQDGKTKGVFHRVLAQIQQNNAIVFKDMTAELTLTIHVADGAFDGDSAPHTFAKFQIHDAASTVDIIWSDSQCHTPTATKIKAWPVSITGTTRNAARVGQDFDAKIDPRAVDPKAQPDPTIQDPIAGGPSRSVTVNVTVPDKTGKPTIEKMSGPVVGWTSRRSISALVWTLERPCTEEELKSVTTGTDRKEMPKDERAH